MRIYVSLVIHCFIEIFFIPLWIKFLTNKTSSNMCHWKCYNHLLNASIIPIFRRCWNDSLCVSSDADDRFCKCATVMPHTSGNGEYFASSYHGNVKASKMMERIFGRIGIVLDSTSRLDVWIVIAKCFMVDELKIGMERYMSQMHRCNIFIMRFNGSLRIVH